MSTILKWGLITGMVYSVIALISNLLGIQTGEVNRSLGFILNFVLMVITFFTIYAGVKEFKQSDLNNTMTFGQGFMTGLKIALIAGAIAGVFALIYIQFIDPDMPEKIMSAAEDEWERKNMPENQREMARQISGYLMNPVFMTFFTILYTAFWGALKSLLAAKLLKTPETSIPVN